MTTDVIEFDPKRRRKARALPSASWELGLLRTRQQEVKKLVANVILVMTNAEDWAGAIAWDEFAERIIIVRACPAGDRGPWNDLADVRTASWLQRSQWRLDASPDLVASAVREVAAMNSVHPLRERLNGLVWDGVERLDTWTSTYLRAADTEVHREIGKRWMLGAVSRAFDPGSQVDTALILEGLEQGEGKSTAIRILSLGFYTDELDDIGSKDAAMQLHGAWIVELSELDAMGRVETSKVKAFLTRRSDRYRAPYGRHVAEHPRQCTFAGTVNHNDYLRDETGGRRFLPIEVGVVDKDALRRDVEQLWAEAVIRYRRGESTYTTNSALSALICAHTSQRYQGDAWHVHVMNYVQSVESISVAECLTHVGVERARWTQSDANRIAKILKSEGFRRCQVRTGKDREWRYFKPGTVRPVYRGHNGDSASTQNHSDVTSTPVVTTINTTDLMGGDDTPGKFGEPGVTTGVVVTGAAETSGHAFSEYTDPDD
jgi:putative DNA primase/helicase